VREGAVAISLPRREKLVLVAVAILARAAAAFLAVSTWRIGGDRAANVALGSLAVLVLASLAGRVAQSLSAARVAGGAAALYPPLLILPGGSGTGALLLLLIVAAAFLLLVSVDRPSSGCALFSGASLALAVLVRPSALALAPLLTAPLLDRRFPVPVRRALAGSALFGLVVVALPAAALGAASFPGLLPFRGGEALSRHSPAISIPSAAGYSALAATAAAGWLFSIRRGVAATALAAIALTGIVVLATHAAREDRVVFWDPVLLVYAAAAAAAPFGKTA